MNFLAVVTPPPDNYHYVSCHLYVDIYLVIVPIQVDSIAEASHTVGETIVVFVQCTYEIIGA